MTRDPPTLSLVILCYRSEELTTEFTARAIKMLEDYRVPSFELILVANFDANPDANPDADTDANPKGTSTDRTPDIARDAASTDPRIHCQAEPKQGRMGWDLRTGLRRARGSYIAFIDGDGQMPIGDVGRLFELIKHSDFDLVKTYRISRADGWRRKLLTSGYNILFRMLFPGVKARDINAKPKLLRREAYEKMHLAANGWFIDAEIMIEAQRHKMKIGEIPTVFRKLDRRGSFVSFGAVFEFLWNLFRRRLKEFFRR